jgi:hypothetical protein
VLLIHAEGNLLSNPTLKCVVDLFLSRGYAVDLRYQRSLARMANVPALRLLPFGRQLWRVKYVLLNWVCLYPAMLLSVLLEKILLYRRYDLIVGVDRPGLIEASALHSLSGTPYVFLSFEIEFADETSVRRKRLERRASRDVALWIVQDAERAAQLEKENGLAPSKRTLVPLASAGSGQTATRGLRDDLGVPANKKVAILMGSIAEWTMAEELILGATEWPDDWVLLVHERYGQTSERLAGIVAKVRAYIGTKIFVSNAAKDAVDDLSGVLSGVAAGLAFYKPISGNPYLGKNLVHLGLASGKISTCLRYGIPVVTNEIGMFAAEIRSFGLGRVVASPAEVGRTLAGLDAEGCAENARAYFARKLDFDLYAGDLWSALERAMARRD